jgi:hypothetical protein
MNRRKLPYVVRRDAAGWYVSNRTQVWERCETRKLARLKAAQWNQRAAGAKKSSEPVLPLEQQK